MESLLLRKSKNSRTTTTQRRHTTTIRPTETIVENVYTNYDHTSSDNLELKITGDINKFIDALGNLPKQKLKRLQEPQWYYNEYGTEVNQLVQEVKDDPFLSELLTQPLTTTFNNHPVIGADVLRKKLLLRDHLTIAETPPLLKISDVREEIIPPDGYEFNSDSLMWCNSELFKQIDKKVFAKFDFLIGDKIHQDEFEFEFIMSIPKYGDLCCKEFKTLVIEPNVQNTKLAYLKYQPELSRTCQHKSKEFF